MGDKIRAVIISMLIFLVPLFFLPITTEFYGINKQYLLIAGCFALILTSMITTIARQKFTLSYVFLDVPVLIILAAIGAATYMAPNKVAASVSPINGIVTIAAMVTLYYYITRERAEQYLSLYVTIFQYSIGLLGVISLIMYFEPLRSLALPASSLFIQSRAFTPAGAVPELIALLGFSAMYSTLKIMSYRAQYEKPPLIDIVLLVISSAAIVASIATYLQTPAIDAPYAPFMYSLRAASSIFTDPIHSMFGYGIGNFPIAFIHAKDSAYLVGSTAKVTTYSLGRTALMHVMAEAGMVGVLSYVVVLSRLLYSALRLPSQGRWPGVLMIMYILMAFVVFPPSFMLFFLIFTVVALLYHDIREPFHFGPTKTVRIHYVPTVVLTVMVSTAISYACYYMITNYQADTSFRQSVASLNSRDLTFAYDQQLKAVTLNPYEERYRVSFAQTNIFIANQIALASGGHLSDSDKLTTTNAIKTSIKEAQAAIALNPDLPSNWENLGIIYKNLLDVAQNADGFAVGAFQRAALLDPYNPTYLNELGQTYYLMKRYDLSVQQYDRALVLDQQNVQAYAERGWSLYADNKKDDAIASEQKALEIMGDNPQHPLYKKVRADIESFKTHKPPQK